MGMGGSRGAPARRGSMSVCVLLAVVAGAAPALAHEPDIVDDASVSPESVGEPRVERRDVFAVAFGSVTRWTATEALNAELRAAGYDTVSPLSQQLSLSIRVALKHVRLSLDVGGEVGMRRAVRKSDGAMLEVNEFLAGVDLGYEIYSDAWFAMFPHAGLAYGTTDVTLPAQTSFSLDHQTRSPPPDHSLRQAATALRVGFVIEHPIVRTLRDIYDERNAFGLLLSLGAGYLLPLHTSNWELVEEREEQNLDTDLTGGPLVPLGGPYIHFAIGVAWFSGSFAPVK